MNELFLVSNVKLTKLKLVILIRIEQDKFSKLFDEKVLHIQLKKIITVIVFLRLASLGVSLHYLAKYASQVFLIKENIFQPSRII